MGSIFHTAEGTRGEAGSSWGALTEVLRRVSIDKPAQLASTVENLRCDRVLFISLISVTKHLPETT